VLRILYLGQLHYGSTALFRLNALIKLGNQVDYIDTTKNTSSLKGLLYRVLYKIKYDLDINGDNKKLVSKIGSTNYNIIWLDKCTHITLKTLKKIKLIQPNSKIVAYSPDDMMNPANQSIQYLASFKNYDFHITTKSYNVSELENLGAKKVLFVEKAFDPDIHKPYNLNKDEIDEYYAEVGFIGAFEEDRFRKILFLAESGIKVVVRGNSNWLKVKDIHDNLIIKCETVLWGHEYAKALNATKINLCFLSKANRDLHTARSIEIPACEAFMLAERTSEHLKLFKEDKEAVFFNTPEELLAKVQYYLSNNNERIIIAKAGRMRCIESNYTNEGRLFSILKVLQSGF